MELNELKIDSVAIEQGAWIGNIPDMGDLRLKVRGLGNEDFRALQSRLFDAAPRSKRIGGRLAADEVDRILTECVIETVLIDWDGLKQGGAPVAYDKLVARKILSNPDYRPFRVAVLWAAGQVGERQAERREDAAGNSSAP